MTITLLKKWCNYTWLYAVYFLGIIMACVLIWNWGSWELSQKFACLLAIFIPLHIFEENSFPAGFYFMNNIGLHSKEPMVYPQNQCTNMITNLGAEIVLIILTFSALKFEASTVT